MALPNPTPSTSQGASAATAPAQAPPPFQNPPPQPPPTPLATQCQKIWASGLLWIITIVVVVVWFSVLKRIQAQLTTEHSVAWKMPADAILNPGPPAFSYDSASNVLAYKGVMDVPTKQQLIGLFVPGTTNYSSAATQAYRDAINRLAYGANDAGGGTVSLLLMLGGWSATLGVLFRLMLSFVNVVCYRKDLDLELWWPYYVLRPPVGFLIGFTVVLLVKAELAFKGEEVAAAGSLWWAGIAFIAGFGASEFTEWLITISRTLFKPGDIGDKKKT